MTKILICFSLLAVVMISGCGNAEQDRQKVQVEIRSTLGAVHDSIVKLAGESQSFELVSQPNKESARPESVLIEREWVLMPSEQSPSKEDRASLIAACESVLKRHIPPQTDTETAKPIYDFQVTEEKQRIRISVIAKWKEQ